MATTDRTDAAAPAEALTSRLETAEFATLIARADGASLAAASLLATACESADLGYQVAVVRTREAAEARRAAADESATVVPVGIPGADSPRSPARLALDVARAMGADPDPAVALAGVIAGGGDPGDANGLADGLDRRPGPAIPTADLADGLAHMTLAHVEYSGDLAAAEAIVQDLGDEDAARRAASVLAIDAVTADGVSDRAATAIERALHPHVGGPLETVEGLADVLGALAATAPSLAISLALGADAAPALAAWRDHGVAVHDAVREAEGTRHPGLLVVHTTGPVEAVARLVRDFRSPEPAVLAVGENDAALATVDAPADPIEAAAEAADGSGLARDTTGYARFEPDREADLVDAVREAI